MVPKGGPPMQADPLLSERDGAAPTSSEPSALRRGYSGLNRHWPTVTRLPSFHSNCISSVKQDAEEVRSQIFRTSRGVTGDQTFKTNVAQKKKKEKSFRRFQFSESVIKTDKHRRLFPVPRPGMVTICSDNFPESNI